MGIGGVSGGLDKRGDLQRQLAVLPGAPIGAGLVAGGEVLYFGLGTGVTLSGVISPTRLP